MPVIHSTMNLFGDAPGPFAELRPFDGGGYARGRALMAERGWTGVTLITTRHEHAPLSKRERAAILEACAGDIEYLITDTTPLTRTFFENASRLKLVCMYGVGTEHIDVEAATAHGVIVTRALDTNSRSVAEFALALLLALARQIPGMHEDLRGGVWRARKGSEIYGKSLGIVGLGAIGGRLARMAGSLGMRLLAAVRTPMSEKTREQSRELAREFGCEILPLDDMLARADYVCLCLPGGKVIMGEKEFSLMRPRAGFINIARGSLVDETALIAALTEERIGGAALDVYAVEPLPEDSPLRRLPNVILQPHVGSNTFEATDAVFLLCLEEIRRRLAGERSPLAFNPEAYDRDRA